MLNNLTVFTVITWTEATDWFLGELCVSLPSHLYAWKQLCAGGAEDLERSSWALHEWGMLPVMLEPWQRSLFSETPVKWEACLLFLEMFVVKTLQHMVCYLHSNIAWYQLHPEMRYTGHLLPPAEYRAVLSGGQNSYSYSTDEKPEAPAAESFPHGYPGTRKEERGLLVTTTSGTEPHVVHWEKSWEKGNFQCQEP